MPVTDVTVKAAKPIGPMSSPTAAACMSRFPRKLKALAYEVPLSRQGETAAIRQVSVSHNEERAGEGTLD